MERDTKQARMDLERIVDARDELEAAYYQYLTNAGWRYHSDTPGCSLVWERDWRHRPLMGNKDFAVHAQMQIDGEVFDEEYAEGSPDDE